MVERVLCPRLVGRDEQLFVLEDALLAAHGGESRFIALGGEAGMGKTRLATELAKRAQRLGWAVLWGSCSEAELPLPYLPLVEAIGNYISLRDAERLANTLGAARRELAQLFPQLGREEAAQPVGDPAQAKLRLFEAMAALLVVPAHEQGVLLVVEDVHWADSATRELLDHLARRLRNIRSLLVLTYRSDELDRRHPLAPLLQTWRRLGIVELVSLSPLRESEIAEMIAAILDGQRVEPEFRDLMYARSEGNPFVVEEMLKEALDRGDFLPGGRGWQRGALEELSIPETVRDTILLRFGRLDRSEGEILEAASVIGRTFDYDTLVAVAKAPEATVQRALEVGVANQLLEELRDGGAKYMWRHALTQEAVGDEIVLPRRQAIHSRAADALRNAGAGSLPVARHLLGAGRFDEAVPVCVAAAEEAEETMAFADALELVGRALPHVRDPLARPRLLCRMGRLLWMDGKPAAAIDVLDEGVEGLEAAGEEVEAARYRLVLGRCRWEQSRPDQAREEFERARQALEKHGPTSDLTLAYMRLAGLYEFEFDPRGIETARKAVEVGRAAGADFERIWAESFLAVALIDAGRTSEGMRMLDQSFEEARHRGYTLVAHNIAYNDAWTRLHMMMPGVCAHMDQLAAEPAPAVIGDMFGFACSWGLRASGDLRGALEFIRRAQVTSTAGANAKVSWRSNVELAEVLLEMGRLDEAAATLPPLSDRAELQDVIYDAAVQIRLRLETDRLEEAVELAREIEEHAYALAPFADSLSVATEALVAAGLLDEAQTAIATARTRGVEAGAPFLDEAEGRILLARGEAELATAVLAGVAREAAERGFRLVEWRARTLAAEALGRHGRRQDAERELAAVAAAAAAAGAALIASSAQAAAARIGVAIPEPAQPASPVAADGEPRIMQAGERLVTSMFADVRGYTALTSATPPADMAERITTLYRWAAAEVSRHYGFVDKFAGDAVMATFNATGTRLDHVRDALEAAIALSGKATLLDLAVGIGIAVGPAVVGPATADGSVSVLGATTNLAARLQTAANAGEIVLSEEAHRRVQAWLHERGLEAVAQELELKGFDGPQPAWRLPTGATP
ncbi:MAG: AAA family ATPase [Solirubrobacterales bacterium]|nr:AAA family ATPase [Solirubrobacterales bacterium]